MHGAAGDDFVKPGAQLHVTPDDRHVSEHPFPGALSFGQVLQSFLQGPHFSFGPQVTPSQGEAKDLLKKLMKKLKFYEKK